MKRQALSLKKKKLSNSIENLPYSSQVRSLNFIYTIWNESFNRIEKRIHSKSPFLVLRIRVTS